MLFDSAPPPIFCEFVCQLRPAEGERGCLESCGDRSPFQAASRVRDISEQMHIELTLRDKEVMYVDKSRPAIH